MTEGKSPGRALRASLETLNIVGPASACLQAGGSFAEAITLIPFVHPAVAAFMAQADAEGAVVVGLNSVVLTPEGRAMVIYGQRA